MTPRWWVFVTGFVIGSALTFGGIATGNSGLVLAGVLIGVALFFSRRYVR